jgi:hypothetical protein
MHIVFIIPDAKSPDGVVSFAQRLAVEFADTHGITAEFLRHHERHPRRFARALNHLSQASHLPTAVFVHYSGYGFATKGAPLFLVAHLSAFAQRTGCPISVFFHELYAQGRFPSSSYWLSPLQRWCARRLSLMSSFTATSCSAYTQELASWNPSANPLVLPVFSTIGELSNPSPLNERPAVATIFGKPASRYRVYQEGGEGIARAISMGIIDRIVDIGDGEFPLPPRLTPYVVRHHALSNTDIASLLKDARYGLLAYDLNRLEKSTIYASYAAHGICPVILPLSSEDTATYPYMELPELTTTPLAEHRTVATRSWAQYQERTIQKSAERIMRALRASLQSSSDGLDGDRP